MDEGDRVTSGQPLAQLDIERLEARGRELAADLERARARLALGRITKDRLAGLIAEGAASQQELDDAREGMRALAAQVELAAARVEGNEVEIGKSTLVAPFDGTITARRRDEGAVVDGGEPVLEVLERAALEARVGVAGAPVDTLEQGERLSVDVQGRPFPATVKAVLPVRGLGTRTVDVLLVLDAHPDAARSGDLVRLTLEESVPGEGLWLPIAALAEGRRGLWTVSVAEPVDEPANGPTHSIGRRTVEIVHSDTERAFVRGPLADGELVVVSGVHRLVPGQRVRLAPDADGAQASPGDADGDE